MDADFLIQQLRQLIFTLASNGHWVFLGTLAIGVFGLGPIGRALASRLRGGKAIDPSDPTLRSLREDLSALNTRLDYSEQLLIEVRDRKLPAP